MGMFESGKAALVMMFVQVFFLTVRLAWNAKIWTPESMRVLELIMP